MGFLRKLVHAGTKVISPFSGSQLKAAFKVAAPIAASFIPGVGPLVAPVVAGAIRNREEAKAARKAARAASAFTDLNEMQGAAITQNRYPQPVAYAPSRATMFQGAGRSASRAKRLLSIVRSVQLKGLQGRMRLSRVAKAVKQRPAKARLRRRFNRSPAMHTKRGIFVGPSERWKILRGKVTAGVSAFGGRKKRAKRARMPHVRRSRRRMTRRTRRAA